MFYNIHNNSAASKATKTPNPGRTGTNHEEFVTPMQHLASFRKRPLQSIDSTTDYCEHEEQEERDLSFLNGGGDDEDAGSTVVPDTYPPHDAMDTTMEQDFDSSFEPDEEADDEKTAGSDGDDNVDSVSESPRLPFEASPIVSPHAHMSPRFNQGSATNVVGSNAPGNVGRYFHGEQEEHGDDDQGSGGLFQHDHNEQAPVDFMQSATEMKEYLNDIPEKFMKYYNEMIGDGCDKQLQAVDELIAKEEQRKLDLIKERDDFQLRLKNVLNFPG